MGTSWEGVKREVLNRLGWRRSVRSCVGLQAAWFNGELLVEVVVFYFQRIYHKVIGIHYNEKTKKRQKRMHQFQNPQRISSLWWVIRNFISILSEKLSRILKNIT